MIAKIEYGLGDPPPHIQRRTEDFYLNQSSSAPGYTTNRGIEEYLLFLPTYKNRNVMNYIHALSLTGESGSILDIGCGEAFFLGMVQQEYPQIHTVGITATDFRYRANGTFMDGQYSRIDYIVGDAQFLEREFPDERFDIITSVCTFIYLGNPLSTLRGAYSLLKPEGLLFIDDLNLYLTVEEKSSLTRFWREVGIEAEFTNLWEAQSSSDWVKIALKRGSTSQLLLPFGYRESGDNGIGTPSIYTFAADLDSIKEQVGVHRVGVEPT